jgi:phosphate-selective porin
MTLSRECRAVLLALALVVSASVAYAGVARDPQEQPPAAKPTVTTATPQTDAPQNDADKPKSKKKKKKNKGKAKDADADAAGDTADSKGDPDADGDAESSKVPKHPSIKIGKDIRLEFAVRIEGDLRGATPDIGRDDAALEWQDRRFGIEGTAFKHITFEVSRELTEDFEGIHDLGEKTAWKDVYVNYKISKELNIEGGRFKLPFGHEELKGETNLDFIYRSLAARVLSPGRDVGLMAHGIVACNIKPAISHAMAITPGPRRPKAASRRSRRARS